MNPRAAILIIALCILAAVFPAASARDDAGRTAGIAGHADAGQGPGGAGQAGVAPVQERETLREEIRYGNLTENAPASNRTKQREEIRAEIQRNGTPAENVSVSRDREPKDRMAGEVPANASPVRAGWEKNPNEVRLAVHTLLAMENTTGGIGPQVSAIARDFNNSAQRTTELKERIAARNPFSRLFFGGDRDAADELANLTVQNQNRIREIAQLANATETDPGTRAVLQEQIRILEAENARLADLSRQERADRGLFGWL